MIVQKTPLQGLLIIELRRFGDDRGWFMESYNRERYAEAGLNEEFVQDNLSFSERGVLRGLHFQNPSAQGKLVSVIDGEVFDVAVDLRQDSPTFKQWYGVLLSGDNRRQFYVPPGFAHGFVVTGEYAYFHYKCTDLYNPDAERSVRWDDPELDIDWPVDEPVLSAKDAQAPLLADVPEDALF
ncbi:dTDP-4-dehydrorhamnose 3,5-epimerase [Persicimonas caeni]|uniref:dTDP-4-dehydrorhamnose 3,5-epimerase n=1 Tax=Persicimonas caeni TaxID=2292766 RepID=A0A4Y6PTP5_PERCE|nr:dTDP-4-dehydrorhamnose 3,5-epimerase [Persicimonas caeni]QDG51692.1 dTDP-4-dehydrorhamnose 3,5-epimerase [Persicimonas caeni]QED32913.1 dTDP-4-dehydrorhamnose 3,5-epimerase [Persicimonas caeni]